MKTLFLLRHAKSSWGERARPDHDRPLAPRGERAAAEVGRYLARSGVHPDLVLCSTALRARQTLEAIAPHLEPAPRVVVERGFYLADPEALLERIRRVEDDAEVLMLVGHNPGLAELALWLAAPSSRNLHTQLERKFPTGALVELGFAADAWSELRPGVGELRRFVRPKDLK